VRKIYICKSEGILHDKKELAQGIFRYIFPPAKETHSCGNSIISVIDGVDAVLIDAAFEGEARQVFEDLEANGIVVKKIIISHFHDDHMEGVKVFKGATVYGSYLFKNTLNLYTPKSEHGIYTPTILIDEPYALTFGKNKLTLILIQGHSECTLLININGQFLHVSDEVILSNEGRLSLPCNDGLEQGKTQLESLNKLKDYHGLTFIPSHGFELDESRFQEVVQNLCIYLNFIIMSNGDIVYKDAVKDCDCSFLHATWHEGNCRK